MQSLDRRLARTIAALAVGSAVLGCSGSALPPAELDTGPDAQMTADGLYPLRGSGYQLAWAKPDVDFAEYATIMLSEPQVAYKRTPRRRSGGSMADPNFALSESQMTRFKEALVEAFQREFRNSEFYQVVDTPGPDTLLIETAIIDLVVLVPTETRPMSETHFSTSTAVMTLLMELRDARSREILARIAERREARTPGNRGGSTLTWSSSVNDATAIRSTFRYWAKILRQRLDRLHEVAPTTAPPDPSS